jgi:hypothetical protein
LLPDPLRDEVADIIERRWNYSHSILHGAGYALNTEMLVKGLLNVSECHDNLLDVLDRMLSVEEAAKARQQYASFCNFEGPFGKNAARSKADAPNMPSWQWWESYGKGAKELQRVAMRVLSQVR